MFLIKKKNYLARKNVSSGIAGTLPLLQFFFGGGGGVGAATLYMIRHHQKENNTSSYLGEVGEQHLSHFHSL
jgi:hypothetical protein